MRGLTWLFDGALALSLAWLAHRALRAPRLFEGTVLFISFGLLMALAWARLRAPDIALAEAAVGAGLTGALLLGALDERAEDDDTPNHEATHGAEPGDSQTPAP